MIIGTIMAVFMLVVARHYIVRRNFNLFHLCFTNEIRGVRQTLHPCKMEGCGRIGTCPWWGPCPPQKSEKKEAVRGNFNRFHLYFINEISGDRHTLHTCKMEVVGRTGACP